MPQSPIRLLASAAVAFALALALFASSAAAAPKEIAYRCGPDICLLDPDNPGNVTNLTDNGSASLDEMPAWSPDGTKLAFVARFANEPVQTRNIYVMEPDAPGDAINLAVRVTHFADGGYLGEPVWSPDGTRIAFVRGADEGSRSILVAASSGTTAIPLTVAEHGQHPSWAPDSGKIAYSFGPQVYLKNADGTGTATPLENGAGKEPVWSPDGSRIAFELPRPFSTAYLQIDSSSGGGTPVVVESKAQFLFGAWSPSGAKIAYHDDSSSGEETYFRVVNADGTGNHGLPIVQGLNVNGPAPSWSPDGSRLVFHGFYYGEPFTEADNTNKVYIANADGSGSVTSLTGDESYEPVWRPTLASHPQVITPSGGSNGPLPGPTLKPKVVWFTNRVPWTPGRPTIPLMSVGCGGLTCGVGTEGKMKAAVPAGILISPLLSASSAKTKRPNKPIIVGRGKVTVPANQTRTLKMRLTKVAIAVLEKVGKLKMVVTVTITAAGAAPFKETHTLQVIAKPAKHRKH